MVRKGGRSIGRSKGRKNAVQTCDIIILTDINLCWEEEEGVKVGKSNFIRKS